MSPHGGIRMTDQPRPRPDAGPTDALGAPEAVRIPDALATLARCRVLPVVTIARAEEAPTLAAGLLAGGLPIVEITLRTDAALDAIRELTGEATGLVVGAGTVLTADQVDAVAAAGAAFVVAPGFDPRVVERCAERGIPVVPGVATPTEIAAALAHGCTLLKLFPAEALGGIAYLRAVAAPFPGVRFVPTGGIGPGSLAGYLAEPAVVACGGSWLAPPALLATGDVAGIARLAEEAVLTVRRATR
jgi:2-dehydro-3-deoxyphosphogluconate aldolase/(4S)-4-hydroxy-2-oxoglutarate aldolase